MRARLQPQDGERVRVDRADERFAQRAACPRSEATRLSQHPAGDPFAQCDRRTPARREHQDRLGVRIGRQQPRDSGVDDERRLAGSRPAVHPPRLPAGAVARGRCRAVDHSLHLRRPDPRPPGALRAIGISGRRDEMGAQRSAAPLPLTGVSCTGCVCPGLSRPPLSSSHESIESRAYDTRSHEFPTPASSRGGAH